MPRYRFNIFVQHRDAEPDYGCHVVVKVDGPTKDRTLPTAMHEAVKICNGYHPDIVAEHGQPYAPRIRQVTELKALKEQKS